MNSSIQKKKSSSMKASHGHRLSVWVSTHAIPILIFLVFLFILLLINRPALYMNDEFIVVNQLHQLDIGHQIFINECKYGCYQNGTPSRYFTERENILGYTLFLPLLAVPILKIFSLFGDQFRLPVIFFWSLIPILFTMIYSYTYPDRSRVSGLPLIYIGAAISMFLMMINLYYYHPFPFTVPDAPKESGAIILTDSIIGALISVVIYQTGLLIWNNWRIALACTLSIMCCSSYLFWAGSAKDHILMTLMVALVAYFFIRSIMTQLPRDRHYAFFCIGLLAWVRPEVGLAVFFGSVIFSIGERAIDYEQSERGVIFLKQLFTSVMATICGSLPLFINNLITTRNILIPPFYYYVSKTLTGEGVVSNATPYIDAQNQIAGMASKSDVIPSFIQLPSLLKSYFFSSSAVDSIQSTISILFYPQSGSISLIAITPLFLVGIIILIGYYLFRKPDFTISDKKINFLLVILILSVFVAYSKSLPGISSSQGVGPDMRYLLPFYYLGGFVGLYPLVRWGREVIIAITSPGYLILLGGIALAITLLMVWYLPRAEYQVFSSSYMICIYGCILLFFVTFWGYINRKIPVTIMCLLFILLLALPLSWQFLMDIFYAAGKVHGYPFWMPYFEYLTAKYIIIYDMGI